MLLHIFSPKRNEGLYMSMPGEHLFVCLPFELTLAIFIYLSANFSSGMNAEKKYQIDKKKIFQITNILNQIIKSTSFLLKNIFLKKISIWYFFPALILKNEFANRQLRNNCDL